MELATPGILALLAVAVLLAAVVAVVIVALRKPQAAADLSAALQHLTQAVQQGQGQAAVLAERLAALAPVAQAVGDVRLELRALSERVLQVEQNQGEVRQGIASLGTGLARTGTVAQSLVEATAAVRDGLGRAQQDLTALQTEARARHEVERQTAESIRRLETVIAGTQTRGAAGENILEAVFARLPVEWQVRDFRVGDRVVEFGLRLPNSLVLPIDSKWAATGLLEQLAACDDPGERQRLKGQIEAEVRGRAKEVRKYLDPALTVSFGVAAVPDAIYELCWGLQAEVFQQNVVLISYSLFVPYLLLVFQTTLRTSRDIDLQKLDAYLESVQASVAALQGEIDGRFARAITMLQNSRAEMGAQLGKVSGGLTGLGLGGDGRAAVGAAVGAGAGEAVAAGVEVGESVAVRAEGGAAGVEAGPVGEA